MAVDPSILTFKKVLKSSRWLSHQNVRPSWVGRFDLVGQTTGIEQAGVSCEAPSSAEQTNVDES
ncbi:hypothetical protein A2480_03510 [Candidatus Uhrbacteria bacterium RIFOXYC2_FULL_47_19]|uniref:Uncharacterized protein n=1 Tax=Candidatus Uhrbacteria bacterium RIFOXYC2_FULL_47_19 TaxID=1802424 RepID=A0A1F7WBZ5_9BACT|nr:MAG: hypothetical protein A2480_03510 [Candidatus Uhrbacteria bacterium RIFOXYC2_FULL_47_19]